jgi:hypothetical protein
MKEFSEYSSVGEVILDASAEGLIRYTKAGKLVLPERPHRPNASWVEKFLTAIVEKIAKSPGGKVNAGMMMKMLRGDNHSVEFNIAIRRLIEERKIIQEKFVTKNIGRPCVYYRLWQF